MIQTPAVPLGCYSWQNRHRLTEIEKVKKNCPMTLFPYSKSVKKAGNVWMCVTVVSVVMTSCCSLCSENSVLWESHLLNICSWHSYQFWQAGRERGKQSCRDTEHRRSQTHSKEVTEYGMDKTFANCSKVEGHKLTVGFYGDSCRNLKQTRKQWHELMQSGGGREEESKDWKVWNEAKGIDDKRNGRVGHEHTPSS